MFKQGVGGPDGRDGVLTTVIDHRVDARLLAWRDSRGDHAPLREQAAVDVSAEHQFKFVVTRIGGDARQRPVEILLRTFQHLEEPTTTDQQGPRETVAGIVAI